LLSFVVVAVACTSSASYVYPDSAPDGPPAPKGVVEVPLTSLDELAYTAPIHVGDQTFQVICDTGSTTLGLASSACGAGCGVTPEYTPGATARSDGKMASSGFGGGSNSTGWAGDIYTDWVTLGSAADVQVALVAIDSQSRFFDNVLGSGGGTAGTEFQGLVGLGPTANLIAGTTSYLATAFAAGEPGELAFQLCPDRGTMWIGGFDASAAVAPPSFTPMVPTYDGPIEYEYSIRIDQLAVGSGASLGSNSDFGTTILDTGNSISFLPTAQFAALAAAIEASAGFQQIFTTQSLTDPATSGCLTTTQTGDAIDATLPPLHIAFPDAAGVDSTFDVPATRSYLIANNGEWCFAFADSAPEGIPSHSLIGAPLLNAFVTIFDVANNQVGFALEAGCGEAVADTTTRGARAQGVLWWQQDPRVRVADRAALRRRVVP
jgi:hypothetical protein